MRRFLLILLLSATYTGCVLCSADASSVRPTTWAQPITLSGVPNLHRVSANLYRSAQPTAEGMTNLVALGIKTVLNLRNFHSDEDEIGGLPLTARRIPINTWSIDNEDARKFLGVMSDTNALPVLVHCQHGADRTGSLVAIYRVVREGWTVDEALKEMREGGFGYHAAWFHLPRFVRETSQKLAAQKTQTK